MEQNNLSKKWYDNKLILILLLFIFPPLGIYGILNHKTATWKKVIYIPCSLFSLIFIIATFAVLLTDHFKEGMDYYNQQNYKSAYSSFLLVSQSSKNYNDAVLKLKEIKPIIDSLDNLAAMKKDQQKLQQEQQDEENRKLKEEKENPSLAFPKVEQDFIAIIQESKKEYQDAPNELKKSAIRTKRGKLIANALGNNRKFDDWIVRVVKMETSGKGKAILETSIEGTDVKLMTVNNDISNLIYKTLIEQTDPLYNKISELKEGDKIKISGTFLESDNNDYINEPSLTESGSMENPGFIVRFNKIE